MTGSRKRWSITLTHNYTELRDVAHVKDLLSEWFAQWIFQLEAGDATHKDHYQCRGLLPEAQMTETLLSIFECRGYDRRDVTFLPESNNSDAQGGLTFYCMKDDTRKEGPWHDSSYCPRKRDTYDGEDLECMKHPFDHQQFIMDACLQPADDRSMCWVVNISGCGGISKLMKYMRMSPTYDMARIGLGSAIKMKAAAINEGPHRIFMIDLPRVRGSDERQQDMFSALADIKNGFVESPMYGSSKALCMEPPHLWVFSKEYPNLSFASHDRWRIWLLADDPSGGHIFRRLSLSEVRDAQNPN
tara:strand:- start:467 stop:1369 length:903 start_codon:yes stop_codon:yes gene_type:complete